MIDQSLLAGVYYVGDLCYVFRDSRWNDACNSFFDTNREGVFTLKDGTRFAIFGTAYGDGGYADQFGNEYPVDSGTIGCVSLIDLQRIGITPQEIEERKLGHIHQFVNWFTPTANRTNRFLTFGHITIDTDPEMEYEDEEYEDA